MSQATDPLGQPWPQEAASPRRITVLGSTGSIGRQTLEVAAWRGYQVVGLVAGRDGATLLEQVLRWRPAVVSCLPEAAEALRPHLPAGTRLLSGEAGACEVAAAEADVVVAAIPGFQGLAPTRAAIRAGRTVALANKEAMVCAGALVWQEARASGARITPVDSEHAALFQSLLGEPKEGIDRLVLTASGGPFRLGPADLSLVTPQQAMTHPNWSMGPKVTVDSATLFNKGLEVLEAAYLFEVPVERIEVVVHPQSLVHGLVRFKDGSLKAQIGPHDMRLPIQYAIEAPHRPAVPLQPLPLAGEWSFHPPDTERFPALALAFEAGRMGGEAPLRLNAADEVAVEAFLAGRLRFSDIPTVLATALSTAGSRSPGWDELAAVDDEARRLATEALDTMAVRA